VSGVWDLPLSPWERGSAGEAVTITRATEADVDALVALYDEAAAWLMARGSRQWPPGWWTPKVVAKEMRAGHELYLARRGDAPVGKLTLQWDDTEVWGEQPPDAGYVHGLCVSRAVAGRGLGAALLDWAAQRVRANGRGLTNAQGYGFILTGWGAGALAGALLASALGNRINRGLYSLLFFTLQVFAVSALAYATSALMAVGCMATFGLLNSLGNVSFLTLIQRKLPRNLLGRIMGVFTFCNFATLPLSVAVGGFATARFGASPVILGGAAIMLGAMVIAFASREIRTM